MKKRSRLLPILTAVALLLSGCNRATQTAEVPAVTDSSAESETETAVRYVYRPAYRDVGFLTEEAVEAFREPLVRLFSNEGVPEPQQHDKNGDFLGDQFPDPDRPGIQYGFHVGLFDIDIDGTPELLINLGGGSAGNYFYVVYDILTGEELGYLNGGGSDSWCTYFRTENGRFESIGQFEWRIGWMGRERKMHKATITKTMSDDSRVLYETPYLEASYSLDAVELELSEEDIEAGIHESWDEYCNGADFQVNGDAAYIDEYFDAYDEFLEQYVRLPETALRLIYRSDYSTPEELVDALLTTGQCFVNPAFTIERPSPTPVGLAD